MTTRTVKIKGTSLEVEVPIYITDWVKFIAVDADGEIWMFAEEPIESNLLWKPKELAAGHSRCDRLPAPGTDSYMPEINMSGIKWFETLTEVNQDVIDREKLIADAQREISRLNCVIEQCENGSLRETLKPIFQSELERQQIALDAMTECKVMTLPERIRNVNMRTPLEVEDMYRATIRSIMRTRGWKVEE